MKKLLYLFLLSALGAVPASAQFSHPTLTFSFSLTDYAGSFDTTVAGQTSFGESATTGMTSELSPSDSALGASGGMAADYGWFTELPNGRRFSQVSILVDTVKAVFQKVSVTQRDTITSGPGTAATYTVYRHVEFDNVPYVSAGTGSYQFDTHGEQMVAYLSGGLVETQHSSINGQDQEIDFTAGPDSLKNASINFTIAYPTAGVTEPNAPDLSLQLWPNPVSAQLHLQSSTMSPVEICDALGRTVLRTTSNASLDIRALPDGMYFARVGTTVRRFEVMH